MLGCLFCAQSRNTPFSFFLEDGGKHGVRNLELRATHFNHYDLVELSNTIPNFFWFYFSLFSGRLNSRLLLTVTQVNHMPKPLIDVAAIKPMNP